MKRCWSFFCHDQSIKIGILMYQSSLGLKCEVSRLHFCAYIYIDGQFVVFICRTVHNAVVAHSLALQDRVSSHVSRVVLRSRFRSVSLELLLGSAACLVNAVLVIGFIPQFSFYC